MTSRLDDPNTNNNNKDNPWMEAESSLTQSALTFGDVNNNNNNDNNNNNNNNHDEMQFPLSWQRGRVRNHHHHHHNDYHDHTNDSSCLRGGCHACFWKIAIAWHILVGGCALLYAVLWQRQLQQQQQSSSSNHDDIRWIERSIMILFVLAGVEGLRALLLMAGPRSKRRAEDNDDHPDDDDDDDCHATLKQCVLWLASLISAVSAMMNLVLALMVLLGRGTIQSFLTKHHVSCVDTTDGDHAHAATLPALACPIVLSLVQDVYHAHIVWWIFLGNSVWECVQWQFIQLHRQALLQPLYVVLEDHDHRDNLPRSRPQTRSSSWQPRNPTTTPRIIRPWWWKSRQEEEAAAAATSDLVALTPAATLTESLLDEYNQHGVPSWVTSSSSTTQHQDPERLESSTIWRLFGIHRANDGHRARDDHDDDDDDDEFESVREEWASRSSEDPFWWSRDNTETNTTSNTTTTSKAREQ